MMMFRLKKRPKKSSLDQDLTRAFQTGVPEDEDRIETIERFGNRSRHFKKNKILKTYAARSETQIDQLPLGEVWQVHSLFADVWYDGQMYRCTQRRTLTRVSETQLIVGDRVRFEILSVRSENGLSEGVIERIEPRSTVLVRADSFQARQVHPIVANAQQMLIVASLHLPEVKWGLVDRMVIAARSGGLHPVICLNKIDTAIDSEDLQTAREVLAHYQSLGIRTHQTCATNMKGVEELKQTIRGQDTVLAGHSGVGKSSLIRAVEPSLDIRIGSISDFHHKGKHTTTSARKYRLSFGGSVIDTPGVKLFGLWGVTAESLIDFFPDVQNGTAPQWRVESYHRIRESL
ncbi:MAG: putative ribosome biogenesis GTPase RsgA [Phycisphaerae bacterium]|jgi:ribosome biogenesis GTPase|nr:MAG: putative ribosome biogenesis GTPase RsgA [Phycisphaerae bacterium]